MTFHQKFRYLQYSQKTYNIDIIFLGVTSLNPSSPLRIQNFHTYHQDRPPRLRMSALEGTAILVYRKIVQHENIKTSDCLYIYNHKTRQ